MEIMKTSASCADCLAEKCKLPLAYAYVPVQTMGEVYSNCEALDSGTLFPELDMPRGVYGKNFGKDGKK